MDSGKVHRTSRETRVSLLDRICVVVHISQAYGGGMEVNGTK